MSGGMSRFLITLSLEVNEGLLLTSLPAKLIDATELKLKNSYQWQPLLTYVTISKHFMIRAKGVRFRATVNDCNTIMQQLLYQVRASFSSSPPFLFSIILFKLFSFKTYYNILQGEEHNTVLMIRVNDLGHQGCYSDCDEKISMPLHAEASVSLIKRGPMSSFLAHCKHFLI